MDLLTGGLILGGIFLGAKALGGSKSSASPKATGLVSCIDASADCAALIACAGPILAKATAADTVTLTKMSSKAAALGCASLVSDIAKKLADLGLGGVGVKTGTPDVLGGYSVIHNLGPIGSVNAGDMIIVGLQNADGSKKYVTPLVFSNPSDPIGTYEKALADIALDKYKKAGGIDPAMFGPGAIFMGGPPDLKDGASFSVALAAIPISLGDVLGVVTSEQMKSGLTATALASPGFAAAVSTVTGEEDFLTPQGPFGSGFGSHGRNLGSNFGAKSQFGNVVKIGG